MRVVVAGAGYAGLQVALRIVARCGPRCIVTLVDRNRDHQIITRLPELVGGAIGPEKALIPYHRLLGRDVSLLQTDVTAFYPGDTAVQTSAGRIDADYLVVALGGSPDFAGVPGAAERTFPVRSVSDAERLRQRLEQVAAERKHVRVVVAGAGYTGTEVAGEIAEWGRQISGSGPSRISITVVAPESRLLSEASPPLGTAAERVLRAKGVQFRLRHEVHAVEEQQVVVTPGNPCEADVVVWAARAHSAAPRLPGVERVTSEGRIPVDPYLRTEQYPRVYIIGDMAAPYDFRRNRVVSASAQMAVAEGNLVGSNIAAIVMGHSPQEFRPHPLGEALALGGSDAVAEVGGIILTGRLALAVKKAALARYLHGIGGARLVSDYA